MDHILQNWENGFRDSMKFTGDIWQLFSKTLSMNPFTKPWADELSKYGDFLKERNVRIESGPWMSPNRVVFNELKVALRKFNDDDRGNPLLLVPPEAGHNSQIADYGPKQSLVQCALEHYPGDIYVVEKLPAGPEHAAYCLDDCIQSIHGCVQHIGEPVHLVGLCQGGWQSAIYTALFPQNVKTLSLAGAPIDFHAGDSMITQLALSLPMSFFETMVSMGQGCMPGAFIVAGFKLMNAWERFFGDDLNLYQNIDNPAFLERHRRFNGWYQFTQPLAGRMYLEIVEHLFKENLLVKGKLEILGHKVDLAKIFQPLFLIAGTKDDITPPDQLFAIENYVSSLFIDKKLADAGHIGVFMGKQIIEDVWTDLFKRLPAYQIAAEPSLQCVHCP